MASNGDSGLLSDLLDMTIGNFGSSSGSGSGSSKTNATQTTTKNETSTTKQQGSQTGKSTTLDPQTLAILTGAISRVAGGVQSLNPDEIINAQKNEAIRQFKQNTMADINTIAQKTGSVDNSFVQLLQNQGQQDLATKLAAIGSQISLNTNLAAGDTLARLVTAAKGGTTTSDVSSANTQDVSAFQKTVEDLVSEITSQQKQEQDHSSGILGGILGGIF